MAGTSEAQRAAITRWEAGLSAQLAELRAKYPREGSTPSAVLRADAEKWHRFADGAAGPGRLTSFTDGDVERFRIYALSLKGIVEWASTRPAGTVFQNSSTMVQTFVRDATGTMQLFMQRAKVHLSNETDKTKALEQAKKAPAAVARWTLETIFGAVGLPSWAVPAFGLVVLGGLLLWLFGAAPINAVRSAVKGS